MKINFNSWNLSLSGGNRFIFELSNSLVDRGHEVTITHVGLKRYYRWFKPIKAEIIDCNYSLFDRALFKLKGKPSREEMLYRLQQNIPNCDVNIATYCWTAYPTVSSKKGSGFYLIQHYEPWFFIKEEDKAYAKATYSLPLQKLCVSHWLTEKVNGTYIGNGINKNKFKRIAEIPKIKDSIMIILRHNIGWKNPDLTLKVVDALESRGYTVFRVEGTLTDEELIETYNKADIFLNLSEKEGFSYNILEAMACGCAVVTSPCSEYLVDMKNVYVLPQVIFENAMVGIGKVLANKDLHDTLVHGGFATAKMFDFENVVDRVEGIIKK